MPLLIDWICICSTKLVIITNRLDMYMQHKVSYLSFFIFAEKLSILDMIGIGESSRSVGSPVAFRWLQGSVFF
jgi:hypothetical protein